MKPILALLNVHIRFLVDSLPIRGSKDEAPVQIIVIFLTLHAIVLAMAVSLSLLVDAQLGALEHDDLLAEIDKVAKLRVLVEHPLVFVTWHMLVAEGKLLDSELGDDNIFDD